MESLQEDMSQLMTGKKTSDSFLSVVGADMNTSFDRPIQYQLVSDTFHVSQGGGQTVQQNQQIQLQIRDDNCIHYLKKCGLAFDLYVPNGYVQNAGVLFTGLEMKIGNSSYSYPFSAYYIQQKLSKMGKNKLSKYVNGLALKHEDFSVIPHEIVPAVGQANAGIFQGYSVGVASAVGANVVGLSNIQAYMRQLGYHYVLRRETSDAAANSDKRIKCFVPLHVLFPALDVLPDDGAIFTGMGSSLQFNIRTNMASDCITAIGSGADISYEIKNLHLLKVFSKLDSPRTDMLLKSQVTLPILKYVHWQQQQATPVINALYSVSKSELIRGLIFAFHTSVPCANALDNTNVVANYLNNVGAQFKSPLTYFPQFPIQQITLNVGGEPILIDMNAIQMFHLGEFLGGQEETYDHPIQRSMKYAYYIDMTKYTASLDAYGSSAKNTTTVQVKITLKTGAGSRTLIDQNADWDQAAFQNFSFISYLETLNFIDFKNGLYSSSS